jgi:hypothetical protein
MSIRQPDRVVRTWWKTEYEKSKVKSWNELLRPRKSEGTGGSRITGVFCGVLTLSGQRQLCELESRSHSLPALHADFLKKQVLETVAWEGYDASYRIPGLLAWSFKITHRKNTNYDLEKVVHMTPCKTYVADFIYPFPLPTRKLIFLSSLLSDSKSVECVALHAFYLIFSRFWLSGLISEQCLISIFGLMSSAKLPEICFEMR